MTPEEYLGRVRATAWHAADYLPAERLEEVHRLFPSITANPPRGCARLLGRSSASGSPSL